ncbi:hypothetical protein BDV96DRAFT_562785 [Lophiotrema nucula]|uniref:Uncharacterized protein n=1 Tax=Lophiotrema nucula TaxID=690887 RepID=A0A6A5ZQP8_9PLEO|nr:hypothetical protein BDV96DRAFT_562785 [Lophiotrema nucula]
MNSRNNASTAEAQPVGLASNSSDGSAVGTPVSSEDGHGVTLLEAQYRGFQDNRQDDLATMLSKLSIQQGWTKKETARRRGEIYEAEFDHHFVSGRTKLEVWQALCEEVGIEDIPSSITQCRKVLQHVYINLVNLIDHRRNPEIPLIKFKNYWKLRAYTRKPGNMFPKAKAKQDGFIRGLLHHMF